MATIKWDENKVLEVVKQCRRAGQAAAQAKLEELEGKGPKYAVMSGSRCVGQLLDVCGFANIKLKSARGKFFQLAKKLSQERENRFYCTNHYHGGGHFSVYDASMRQEMSVNEASCRAMANILSGYGIACYVETRID